MSLRGATDFVATWQSRGSAYTNNKVAFRRIPTAPNVHVYLAVVSIEAIGNSVPRDDLIRICHYAIRFQPPLIVNLQSSPLTLRGGWSGLYGGDTKAILALDFF